MEWATAPVMPGQRLPASKILNTFRKTQLVFLAKAYELEVDEEWPKDEIVQDLERHEQRGVFNNPPKHPYYFERAKFNSDSMQEAKHNGGFEGTRAKPGRFVTVLGKWQGPLPPEEKAPEIVRQPKEKADAKNLSEWHKLKAKAKSLGISTGMRNKEAILKEIAIREGSMARSEETAA